jgi:LPPG:FO 2-phospho-L-lactate transferase
MLAVLSGGTGTPKLLQGLARLVGQEELTVIVNTADDLEQSGIYVAPDLDVVTYTLAGLIDEEKWYGIRGDTYACHEMLARLGHRELLRMGDCDRAVSLWRTFMLRRGMRLSGATSEICRSLGVRARVLPMTDDRVETIVLTEAGEMSFQEFWVARRARVRVYGVRFKGIGRAAPAPGVVEAIEGSEAVIIGPSNPVTSIGPILRVREIGRSLAKLRRRVLAISPIIGKAPVSGPAGVLMRGIGYEVSPPGVARIYRRYAGALLVDTGDEGLVLEIERMGIRAFTAPLLMPNLRSKVRLARHVLGFFRKSSEKPRAS